ncbi:(2,3-dihydroxybenzoyl)adenylate synthase [Amycolatopsis nigrescens]|uniref:(2,3-dihydroxybenzoyl)adenylate synthase n=1 Tax=Amycolatopsis nigrescens TaxID=381445 RepID=UPI000378E7B8|nr:(2,3-dihydroxybenzoyl)adenylate synthase [Amycolatopsis nigrescens]
MTAFTPWPAEFAEHYRASGYWLGQNFPQWIAELTARHGDRIAVCDERHRWTYADLDRRSGKLAAGLRATGIGDGDRVVVQLPNVAEFVELVFALFKIGALPVFALPAHRHQEISYFCRFTGAAAYVIADRHGGFDYRALARTVRAEVPGLRHVVVLGEAAEFSAWADIPADGEAKTERTAGEPAFLQLSGGSTGLPKLIPRTADDYLYSVRESARICRLGPDTRYLVTLPAAHNFALSSPGILGVLHAGGRIVMSPAPSPDVAFPLIEAERVTMTGVVPPVALTWMASSARQRHDLSSLRLLQVGGAKFAAEAARRVRGELGCELQQVFGMAEGLVNYTRRDDPEDVVHSSQGSPISPADEIRVVGEDGTEVAPGEQGELLTRGPYTIRGYYRAAEHNATAFTEDGFYRTGDVVRRLPSGHLVVEGRAKDQINRGGEKVAPEEVENHLLAHPGVHDAAVVSMPDRFLGERTCAFVIPVGEPAPTGTELRAFLRQRGLALFKVPDRVEIVPAFPHTGVGKVSRRELRRNLSNYLSQRTT